jgi:hypothetical protein
MSVGCVLQVKIKKEKRRIIETENQVQMTYRVQENTKKKIPEGARFFAPVQNGPGSHPAFYTMVDVPLSRG